MVVGLFTKERISPSINLFLKTGVCGGFTTFSTFSLETLTLLEDVFYALAVVYAMISVIGCIIGVYLGRIIVQQKHIMMLLFLYYLFVIVYNDGVKVYEFVGWKQRYFMKMEAGVNPELSRSRERELKRNTTGKLGRC